jgi:hypothetical protein
MTTDFSCGKKRIVRALLLGAPLLLAACAPDFGPYPMPGGYTHDAAQYGAPGARTPAFENRMFENHGGAYQAPHAAPPAAFADNGPPMPAVPPPQVMGQPTMSDMGVTAIAAPAASPVSASWREAADDLVARLARDFGQPAESVYIHNTARSRAEHDYENALRVALPGHGFNVAENGAPFVIEYGLLPVSGSSQVKLNLTVISGGQPAATESGVYNINGVEPAGPSPTGPGGPDHVIAPSAPLVSHYGESATPAPMPPSATAVTVTPATSYHAPDPSYTSYTPGVVDPGMVPARPDPSKRLSALPPPGAIVSSEPDDTPQPLMGR